MTASNVIYRVKRLTVAIEWGVRSLMVSAVVERDAGLPELQTVIDGDPDFVKSVELDFQGGWQLASEKPLPCNPSRVQTRSFIWQCGAAIQPNAEAYADYWDSTS